jgi:hypothetical protein
MIYYLVTDRHSSTIRRLLRGLPELRSILSYLTYEELFLRLSGPAGHYVFTDIDRLTRYERETAANFATALRRSVPDARLLNDPVLSLDRAAQLTALHHAGINDFTAVRLDTLAPPPRFPVFIRTEDGHYGPETDLLRDAAAFEAAVRDLRLKGRPLHGRIAVGYAAAPETDGKFRRYSAFRIGDRVFGDELFIGDRWAVKDAAALWTADTIAEELAFVRSNPHEAALREAFVVAGIDFGRADYGLVDGRVQVYEINTNPTFSIIPRDHDDRAARRNLARQLEIDALRSLDTPISAKGRVGFARPPQRPQRFRHPRGLKWLTSLGHRIWPPRRMQ